MAFLPILNYLLTQMRLYGMFLSIWMVPCAHAQILDLFVLISSTFIGLAFSKARASFASPEAGGAEVGCVPGSAWVEVAPLNEAYPWPLCERGCFLLFASCSLFSLGEGHWVVAACVVSEKAWRIEVFGNLGSWIQS